MLSIENIAKQILTTIFFTTILVTAYQIFNNNSNNLQEMFQIINTTGLPKLRKTELKSLRTRTN